MKKHYVIDEVEIIDKDRVWFLEAGDSFYSDTNDDESIEYELANFIFNNPNYDDVDIEELCITLDISREILLSKLYEFASTILAGGLSHKDNSDASDKEVNMGLDVEMEHLNTQSPFAEIIAYKIQADHHVEDKNYYTKLSKIE